MKLRCRDGDVAIIIREEKGCECNIGRFVEVFGPVNMTDDQGPVWCITPLRNEVWTYLHESTGRILTEVITCRITHPDYWLLPFRGANLQAVGVEEAEETTI